MRDCETMFPQAWYKHRKRISSTRKLKKLTGILTNFGNLLSQLNKNFNKRTFVKFFRSCFFLLLVTLNRILYYMNIKNNLNVCSKCINYNLTKGFSDLIIDANFVFHGNFRSKLFYFRSKFQIKKFQILILM